MDALKGALQPITHNLPAPIRDLGISLIGAECYKALVSILNFSVFVAVAHVFIATNAFSVPTRSSSCYGVWGLG